MRTYKRTFMSSYKFVILFSPSKRCSTCDPRFCWCKLLPARGCVRWRKVRFVVGESTHDLTLSVSV